MKSIYVIVGQKFVPGADKIIAQCKIGDPLVLVREPQNPHDPNAIGVWAGGMRIGYLLKKENAELAALIDAKGIEPCGLAMDGIKGTAGLSISGKFVVPGTKMPHVQVDI